MSQASDAYSLLLAKFDAVEQKLDVINDFLDLLSLSKDSNEDSSTSGLIHVFSDIHLERTPLANRELLQNVKAYSARREFGSKC